MLALVPVARQRRIRILQRAEHSLRITRLGLVARRFGGMYGPKRAAEIEQIPLQIRHADQAEVALAQQMPRVARTKSQIAKQRDLREKIGDVFADLRIARREPALRRAN